MKKFVTYLFMMTLSILVLTSCGNRNSIVGEYKGEIELDTNGIASDPFAASILKSQMDKLVLEFNFNKDNTGYNHIEFFGKKEDIPFTWSIDGDVAEVIIPGQDTLIFNCVNEEWSSYSELINGTITLVKLDDN